MNIERLTLEPDQLRRLLACGSDAALLYLYLRCGNDPAGAASQLHLSDNAALCAAATLRQVGLWDQDRKTTFVPGQRPSYTETDVIRAMDQDSEFRTLYAEVQRLLGKSLNTEELKILLSFTRYLGLPNDVICVLVCWCKDRSRQRGSMRNPSLRTIEKEAYAWAEQGIDTLEDAGAYIQMRNQYNSRLEKLKRLLQIRGRNLTAGEERYAESWLNMPFEEEVLALAYERTCLNTGGLNWAYMNKILTRWHESGLHTLQAIKAGDRKTAVPKGASGELGQAELEAIERMMREG